MTMKSDDLPALLARDLRPVRRVPRPVVSVALWTGIAGLVVGAAVLVFGVRADFGHRLPVGVETFQIASAAATGLLASVAAFHLALPDRDPRWAWLPAPAAMAWLATVGWGCVADLLRFGPSALVPGVSMGCLSFIMGLGVPLSLGVMWLLRHAAFFRPGPVALLGAMSAAAYASVGLTLVHVLDATIMVLVWHGLSMLAVMGIMTMIGPRLMRAAMVQAAT